LITDKQKFENFNIAVNQYAEEQRQAIEAEISRLKETRLAEAESAVLRESFYLIQKEMVEMRHRITREMALRETEAHRNLLKRRQEITDEIFFRVKQNLIAFTESPEYTAFLVSHAKEVAAAFTTPGITIHMRAKDQTHFDLIQKTIGQPCLFEEDPSIQLGGFLAENKKQGLMVDATIDTLLAESYDWFEQNAELPVC